MSGRGDAPGDDPAARFARVDHGADRRRARDLRAYGHPRRHTDLIWLAIAVTGALVFVALIWAILERSKWTAGATGRAAPVVTRPFA